MNNITLHKGDSSKVLKKYPDNHFDSIVTDPPYGIEFLGKEWDKNTGAIEVWQECLRVLKPGGHILAFSAARTYHRLATNLEDIGFEIRDQIMWIYGSGFPKGQDMGKLIEKRKNKDMEFNPYIYREEAPDTRNVKVGNFYPIKCKECDQYVHSPSNTCTKKCNAKFPPKLNEWSGWKTGLKPAHEPIVMARKPFKGSTVDNVLEYGVGAINIDDTRVEVTDTEYERNFNAYAKNLKEEHNTNSMFHKVVEKNGPAQGRYPSNVIMSEEEGKEEYKKYFYCPKVSRKERNIGFDLNTIKNDDRWKQRKDNELFIKAEDGTHVGYSPDNKGGNNHPTVKPVALMKYLVTLVTPKGGKVLDPFNGSGSTGMAVKEFGGEYVGIDLNKDYIEIAKKRIKAWSSGE